MSIGGPFDNSYSKDRLDRWTAEAEASRAARTARAAGAPSSAGRMGLLRRWRERRRLRHTDLLERKATARENLRDLKQSRDEPGQWTGGM
jgi:hypothetical protein